MVINTKLKFKAKISSLLPLEKPFKIAAAVSGGSDSLALLILLINSLQSSEIELICLTVDHKLRPESFAEAALVSNICKKLKVSHQILDWDGIKPSANMQHTARKARYKLLTDFCSNNQIEFLATAHQEQDQAENFLIRLEHGTGLYGLAGIAEKNVINGINIIRPLLEFSKEELRNVLLEEGIEWVEDPSNNNRKYTRTKFRVFLNRNPTWIHKLNLASKNLLKTKESIEYLLQKTKDTIVKRHDNGTSFDHNDFNLLPQEIKFRLISDLISDLKTTERPLRGERIENLINKLSEGKSFKAATLGKCLFKRKGTEIIISCENS